VIRAGRKLRVISNFGDGYEHIALEEATRRGIPVGNTPDVLTETTADLIFALILAAARRIVEGDAFTRQGKWRMHAHLDLPGVDVHHATLGIVGLGKIGSHVAKRARAFNMRVLYNSKTRKVNMESLLGVEWVPELHSLLSQSDFVALTPRLTEETRHMIGRDEFAVMKPNAVLVNGARGAVIDEKALFEALSSRRILRAALDVTEIEPLPVDDPLLTLDNLIVMPHIGSAVPATREKMMAMAVDQMILGLNGERIPNCVNPVVYRAES
jgi:glyoxylate reductase